MTNSITDTLGGRVERRLQKLGVQSWEDLHEFLMYHIYQHSTARAQMKERFSSDDLVILVDSSMGVMFDPLFSQVLAGNVQDYLWQEGYCSTEESEEHPLVKKLRALTPFEEYVLTLAIQEHFRTMHDSEDSDLEHLLDRITL